MKLIIAGLVGIIIVIIIIIAVAFYMMSDDTVESDPVKQSPTGRSIDEEQRRELTDEERKLALEKEQRIGGSDRRGDYDDGAGNRISAPDNDNEQPIIFSEYLSNIGEFMLENIAHPNNVLTIDDDGELSLQDIDSNGDNLWTYDDVTQELKSNGDSIFEPTVTTVLHNDDPYIINIRLKIATRNFKLLGVADDGVSNIDETLDARDDKSNQWTIVVE